MGECCIACGVATQKKARRKVSECSDVLSFWEEASRKVLQESSHHKLSEALHDASCAESASMHMSKPRENWRYILYFRCLCQS